MDWESMFANKKNNNSTTGEEEESSSDTMIESTQKTTPFSRKPLQNVNERIPAPWARSGSFKSPEKTLDIEDSQDSGISFSPSHFRIKKLARRSNSKGLSPANSISKLGSFGSVEEDMEVGDVFDEENYELPSIPDVPNVPNAISRLMSGPIIKAPVECNSENVDTNKENYQIRRAIPRRLGFIENDLNSTPTSSKTYELFKRPGTPGDVWSPSGHKRIKSVSTGELPSDGNRLKFGGEEPSSEDDSSDMDLDASFDAPKSRSKSFHRSQSESAVSIMKAVDLIDSDSMLIGDASKRFVLPVITDGKHKDLKEITSGTLVKLMNGEYKHLVDKFEVIDCRYPYEYQGGHIKGAINIHTQKQLHERYLQSKEALTSTTNSLNPNGRHILLFHCEFSSQRAPDLCRFLREADRKCNSNAFPNLHYPELYIIHGGYKAFFESYKEHCDPQAYLEMADRRHTEACRWHKTKSKTDVVPIKSSSTLAGPKVTRKQGAFKKFCI